MADLFSQLNTQLSLPEGLEEGFDFPLEGSDADGDMQFLELWPELLHEQVGRSCYQSPAPHMHP